MATLRFKTGQEANLPSEAELGQPLFTQDTNKLFIGKGTGNPLTEISTSVFILRQGIINPDCAVAQRATPNLSTSYQYGAVDRFAVKATGNAVSAGTITQKTTSTATTSGKSVHISGATITGSGVVYARYRMESKDSVNFKNLTSSFGLKVLHDVGSSINYTITVNKANAADDFSAVTQVATSGNLSVATGTTTTIKLENISLGDVTNGIEVIVQADCGAVTTKNFEFGEWQFNKGATKLSFTTKSIGETIRDCQRYYWQSWTDGANSPGVGTIGSIAYANNAIAGSFRFPVEMRTTPTASIWNNNTQNQLRNSGTGGTVAMTNLIIVGLISKGFSVFYSPSATPLAAGTGYDFDIKADSEL